MFTTINPKPQGKNDDGFILSLTEGEAAAFGFVFELDGESCRIVRVNARLAKNYHDFRIPDLIGNLPVTTIGKCAFMFSEIGRLYIPNTVKTIEREAFSDSVIKRLRIPPQIETIERMAFFNCKFIIDMNLNEVETNVIKGDAFERTWLSEKWVKPTDIINVKKLIKKDSGKTLVIPDGAKRVFFNEIIRCSKICVPKSVELISGVNVLFSAGEIYAYPENIGGLYFYIPDDSTAKGIKLDRIHLHIGDDYVEFPLFLSLKSGKVYTEKYLKLRNRRIGIIKRMLNGNPNGLQYYDDNILDTLTKMQGAETAYKRLKSGFALTPVGKARFEEFLKRNSKQAFKLAISKNDSEQFNFYIEQGLFDKLEQSELDYLIDYAEKRDSRECLNLILKQLN